MEEMFPLQGNLYGHESWSNRSCSVPESEPPRTPAVNVMDGGDSVLSSASKAEIKKSTEACKSHKEAERRRRQRINAHLSTLRTLLPNTTKTDKASLLAEVVHQVKELKKRVADVARHDGDTWLFPGDSDELTVSYSYGNEVGETKKKKKKQRQQQLMIKATLCCEDRPGLNRDLNRAIESIRAKAVRAEMMTVGGRTKSVVMMQWGDCEGDKEDEREGEEEVIRQLKRALKDVVENRASRSGPGRVDIGVKRAQVFGRVHDSD